MKKLIITAVMLGTYIAPAMAIPPKYQGTWCQVGGLKWRKELILCVADQETTSIVKVETNQIRINGYIGKARDEFTEYEGPIETWIVHYDFGARGKETYKFMRGTKPDGRAELTMIDLTYQPIGRELRRRDRAYGEPAPRR